MKLAKVRNLIIATAILLVLGNWNAASASVVFSVEVDPPVNAGDTATVSFFATSDTPGGQALSGFNLPVDFGNDGNLLAAGFSIPDIDGNPANPINGSASLNFAALQNSLSGSDAIVNLVNGTVFTVGSTDTFLFDLLISTPASAPVGSFPVSIVTDSPFFVVNAADNSILTSTSSADPAGGSVNIVAIPEPSSTIVMFAGISGLMIRRRRQRQL